MASRFGPGSHQCTLCWKFPCVCTFNSSPDACRDSVHDSYYDEGFAAASWLRWCDAWVAIGLAAEGCHGAARVASNGNAKIYAEWELLARQAMAQSMGIPAEEAK